MMYADNAGNKRKYHDVIVEMYYVGVVNTQTVWNPVLSRDITVITNNIHNFHLILFPRFFSGDYVYLEKVRREGGREGGRVGEERERGGRVSDGV